MNLVSKLVDYFAGNERRNYYNEQVGNCETEMLFIEHGLDKRNKNRIKDLSNRVKRLKNCKRNDMKYGVSIPFVFDVLSFSASVCSRDPVYLLGITLGETLRLINYISEPIRKIRSELGQKRKKDERHYKVDWSECKYFRPDEEDD